MADPTLLEYLCTRFPHVDVAQLLEHSELDGHHEKFRYFLTQTRLVTDNSSDIGTETSLNGEILSMPYPEFIDAIAKSETGPQNQGQTNFKTGFLKGTEWEILCTRLGRQLFADMLGEIKCIILPLGNVSLGLSAYVQRKPRPYEPVRKFHMYFSPGPTRRVTSMFLLEAEDLVKQIFKYKSSQRHLPKKHRPLLTLIKTAKHNDLKVQYPHLLANISPVGHLEALIFENSVPFLQVTRAVFSVVHRVFPTDTFGCQKNWNLVNQYIYEMLKSERTEAVDTRGLVAKLTLTAIPWLGKSPRVTSKQDFLLRRKVLQDFVHWFFSRFITRIVTCFWYVTDNPVKSILSEPANAFFLHASWSHLSCLWLREYVHKYLNQETETTTEKGTKIGSRSSLARFNYGVLRLVPKKSDFRPLCIPLKTSRSKTDEITMAAQKKQHALYDYTTMRPIRDILRNQQRRLSMLFTSPFPRCNSVNDVGISIANFKAGLMLKCHGRLPPLFGVQFDMKHCYDNLNQAKILFCIEELFRVDPDTEEYIVRKYAHQPKSNGKHATPKSLIKTRAEIEELDVFAHPPATGKAGIVCGDKLRTFKFTRGNVLDLVRSQVLDAATELPKQAGTAYKRTRGVFQGLPLLGTLCDIVYNSLVDNVLAQVRGEHHECILLRLADDFLFISTSRPACEEMLQRARCREAKEYGAHVNQEKISWIDATTPGKEHAQFLGLTIDLRTLSLERQESNMISLSTNVRRSLKASLAYLDWRFRLRVSEYLLDMRLLDFHTVSNNACNLYAATLNRALLSAQENCHEPDAMDRLGVFAFETMLITLRKFEAVNGQSEFSHRLYSDIWQVLNLLFKRHGVSKSMLEKLVT